jgi:hypothetical protein
VRIVLKGAAQSKAFRCRCRGVDFTSLGLRPSGTQGKRSIEERSLHCASRQLRREKLGKWRRLAPVGMTGLGALATLVAKAETKEGRRFVQGRSLIVD